MLSPDLLKGIVALRLVHPYHHMCLISPYEQISFVILPIETIFITEDVTIPQLAVHN